MARVLLVETSSGVCSVGLCDGQTIVAQRNSGNGNATINAEHSRLVAPFIEEVLREAQWSITRDVEAVAVDFGPGSYTGLRIGLSTAKGLCFAAQKPLLTIDSLRILVNQLLLQQLPDSESLICPLIDARRMEVYTAMYDNMGKQLTDIKPVVVDDTTFNPYRGRRVIVCGSGAEKCVEAMLSAGVEVSVAEVALGVAGMMGEAQRLFDNGLFADVAYAEPLYLKEWQSTTAVPLKPNSAGTKSEAKEIK